MAGPGPTGTDRRTSHRETTAGDAQPRRHAPTRPEPDAHTTPPRQAAPDWDHSCLAPHESHPRATKSRALDPGLLSRLLGLLPAGPAGVDLAADTQAADRSEGA